MIKQAMNKTSNKSPKKQKQQKPIQHQQRRKIVNLINFINRITCMIFLICLLMVCLVVLVQGSTTIGGIHRRMKRALYELPDGAEFVVGGNIRTSFTCEGLGYGYYADVDNECKLFHICQSFKMSDGSIYNNHWSFMCGNQTVFNQVSLSCSHPEDAVPCENAREFYYVNDYFGDVRSPSIKESDLSTAHDLVSRAYGSRITSQL